MTQELFTKKVALNVIITVDLADYEPESKSLFFDMKDGLVMGMLLKEKDFRDFLAGVDWEIYRNKPVAIGCTTDAIIPMWAYMSVAEKLCGIASQMDYTTAEMLDLQLWKQNIEVADFSHLAGQKAVVRQSQKIAPPLYVAITDKLKSLVKTLMYGEAGLPKVIYKK